MSGSEEWEGESVSGEVSENMSGRASVRDEWGMGQASG